MRLAVVADIHGNLAALEAVLADMAGRRIDATIDLGDCVSGPLWPRETLDALRRLSWPTVRGNHDRAVATRPPAHLGRTDAFAHAALDADAHAYLAALPVRLTLGDDIVAFHARPDDDEAYLLEDVADGRLVPARPATIAARLAGLSARLILCAHSHRPGLVRLADGRTAVNPGSVGCPAYDDPTPPTHVSETGNPCARYAIVETGDSFAMEFIALDYDHAAAVRRALAAGRPDWAHALATGYASEG